MKKFYKILIGILAIGIVFGIIGSFMISAGGSDIGNTLFMVGVSVILVSIFGIRTYYIRSDPVRFAKFKRDQDLKRQERARRARIYHDERLRAKAWSDEEDERRRADW